MKKITLTLIIATYALLSNAQGGYLRPPFIGWPPVGWDSTEWPLTLNPLTGKGKWSDPGSGSDSVFTDGTDTLCFIVMADTTCVEVDSTYITANQICFIEAGDTTCLPYNTVSGNIYTMDGAFTANRIATVPVNQTFRFRRNEVSGGQSDVFTINVSGASSSAAMTSNTTSNTQAILSLNNGNTGSIYQHWNGIGADEDYTIGINKTANSFNFCEGTDIGLGTGIPFMSYFGGGDSLVIKKNTQVDALMAVGESTVANMTGQLTIAEEGSARSAIVVNGFVSPEGTTDYHIMSIYPVPGDTSDSYQLVLNDDKSLYLWQTINDAQNIPLQLTSEGNFNFTGSVSISGRLNQSDGSDIASANIITIPNDGNTFYITGNTQINNIAGSNLSTGAEINLIFASNPLIKNNNFDASNIEIRLAGAADFSATEGDVLKLVLRGGTFYEVSRSAN